ncbi:MAG: serine/threonine-protein kinase [Pseudomonadota bacterium]
MTDWAKLTAGLEHALTLDEGAAEAFLEATIEGDDTLGLARRLLARSKPGGGFMQTGGVADDTAGEGAPSDILDDGSRIDVWELQGLVGQGGMGQVYRARRADGLYDQTVALKVISRDSALGTARFQNERRRLAQLEHPGIARIVDGGVTPDGRAYMAMEFVDGRPIDKHAGEEGLDRQAKLSLFERLCSAVSHAHARLILHRDIKPENVLVDGGGQVRLIDFGIASELGEDDQQGPALTISSAAPEQLKGEHVSVQTDIFALGVLLHRLLTGAFPQREADGSMVPDAALVKNRDTLAVLDRCLSASPEDRYASVDALREDTLAVLEHRPVDARSGGHIYRIGKFFTRYPLASALGGVAIAALVGGLAASLSFAADAQAEAERTNVALAEAQANLERSEYYLSRADLFFSIQTAYSDTLQSMFGGEADVDQQTEVLVQRWRQAYELREQDPTNAAYLSYAIGRQFLFRNDYLTAIDILKPWVDDGYGPSDLLGYARQLLAVAYMSVGREEEALPMLRETEAWLADGYDAASPDHIAAATQIATITGAEEDIRGAELLLLVGLEQDHGPSINMYFWNQLSRMRQMRGDFSGGYEAMLEVVSIIDATPLMDVSGTDTGRLSLADFELWHTGDIDRAEALATAVLNTARETKGESREMGLAFGALAWVSTERGTPEAARDHIEAAIAITSRYSGETSSSVLNLKLQRAEILADLGDPLARDALDTVRSEFDTAEINATLQERFKLASLYVSAQLEGQEASRNLYLEADLNQDLIRTNLALSYLHARLESAFAKD